MIHRDLLSEPSVLGSIWRNRRFVVLGAGLGFLMALAFVLAGNRNVGYVAAATVEVVDPSRSSLLSDSSGQTSDRFVSNQLLIFRSSGVASRAAELAVDEAGRPLFSPSDIIASSTILSQPGTDVISVIFTGDNADSAIAGANAITAAYQAVKTEAIEARAAATLGRIDAALSSVGSEIRRLEGQISTYNPDLGEVGERIQSLVDQLLVVHVELDSATGTVADLASERLSTLMAELQSLQLVQNVYDRDPGLTALLQEQGRLIDWSLQLTTRRLELEIDQQQAASGVGTLSQASTAQPQTTDAWRLPAFGIFMGAVAGAGVAFWVANSRRVILDSLAPEGILDAPFLGEVPDFASDDIESVLPVRDAPRSASAESFRFVATSLESQMEALQGELIAVVSSETGDGKSVVVANTALSAAYGRRVLVVDADFGNQNLGSTFGVNPGGAGLTDVVARRKTLGEAMMRITTPDNASIMYLGRGTMPATAPDFFRRRECQIFFESLKGQFDLILVDTPALLQVAYGATVARLCVAAVAVVSHEARESQLVELRQRLSLVGIPVLGYVYNRAPLRAFMTRSEGSMKDVVGDRGYVVPVEKRRN